MLPLKNIQKLEEERLFERGHLKVFYFRFSEIMSRYLEELRGFPAVEFTTQEIALAMKDKKDRVEDIIRAISVVDPLVGTLGPMGNDLGEGEAAARLSYVLFITEWRQAGTDREFLDLAENDMKKLES